MVKLAGGIFVVLNSRYFDVIQMVN